MRIHRPGVTRLGVTAGALPRIDLTMLPRLPDLGEELIPLSFHDYATMYSVHSFLFSVLCPVYGQFQPKHMACRSFVGLLRA